MRDQPVYRIPASRLTPSCAPSKSLYALTKSTTSAAYDLTPDRCPAVALHRRWSVACVERGGGGQAPAEVHPEVSFAALAGAPLPDPKTTWAGATHRRRLLAEAGIELPDDLGPAGSGAAVVDVLDAAAAAWTARRVAHGQASPMPDPPEVFSDGLPAAIWT